MIGIKAISSYIPENKVDNIEQALAFSESSEFIINKIGALYLPRMGESEDTSDIATKAVLNLIRDSELSLDKIDVIAVVTQNGDGAGLPHTSAIVQSKLGLKENIAAFDISLGCSGYVYGLSIVKGLMEQADLKNGILITADPYSKIIDRSDRTTSLLFGDAATATWMGEDAIWNLQKPLFSTDGIGASNLTIVNNSLSMNGRQVFNFASKQVPKQIKECLIKNKLDEIEIDLYCIHQGSKAIVEAIAKRFPNSKEKFISDINETGNTVSSSIPLLLEKKIKDDSLKHILVSGFGVGLSWSSNIISREV
ncbi:ketoacyl-ACP synthase III [Halomonas sp. SpR1]|uniref:ketoacyl-ACP synthase III n=1 Tax=Halomonas sp. SpR1 TaxID=3050462 RepID=UPI0027E472AA|nr:ketoacyl-ACP synthase III [Halomonas sp. SpR1]MDQ7732082.1 ketoacyl-ACP synthase III [Halomonas sp. SpR1]